MTWIKKHKKMVVFLAAVLVFLAWHSYDHHFTPERWAKMDEWDRYKVVDSLLEQYDDLVGMSAEEVVALLGGDTEGEQSEEQLTPQGSQITELLAYPLGGRMFPTYLLVYLEDGRVTGSRILVD